MAPDNQPRRRFDTAPAKPAPQPERREQQSLRMIYAPVLAYAVLFQRAQDKSGIEAKRFRQGIRAMLDKAGEDARMAGYDPAVIQHVRFSIVAFVDEVVITSDWPYKEEWMSSTLQLEEFETNVAGDQFFDRLEAAGEIDPEVAEIDFTVLSLGFKGRYMGLDTELDAFRRRLFKRFPPQAVSTGSRLTPEAYEEDMAGLRSGETGRSWWKWIAVAAVAFALLLTYTVFQFRVSGAVSRYEEALQETQR